MKSKIVKPANKIKATITLPGDKSISQRAIIIPAISQGKTLVDNLLWADDCRNLIRAFKSLGVKIRVLKRGADSAKLSIEGRGLYGLNRPDNILYLGNSGTAARILCGLLAAQAFPCEITGDASLSSRPMLRVIKPLREMGALTSGKKSKGNECLPIKFKPTLIFKGIKFKQKIPSAQVKSAILLAGLYAKGMTEVIEPIPSRNHTENMLKSFGAHIKLKGRSIVLKGGNLLKSPGKVFVPSDISSAAYFIVAALLVKDSDLLLKNVGVNFTRSGILSVLKRMKADIKITKKSAKNPEPVADLRIKTSDLKGCVVREKEIPLLVDEVPLIMVAACFAKNKTVIKGAQELRVKETDRIKSMCSNLGKMGANIKVKKRGKKENIIIYPVKKLKGAKLKSFGDHRTAMCAAIAALAAEGKSKISGIECINKSFPGFFLVLKNILKTNRV